MGGSGLSGFEEERCESRISRVSHLIGGPAAHARHLFKGNGGNQNCGGPLLTYLTLLSFQETCVIV